MKIGRYLHNKIAKNLLTGKVIVLYGACQVGKTTLANDILAAVPRVSRLVNADELIYREALASQNKQQLGELLGQADLLIIDEAQRVPNIGLNLKILIDSYPGITILATGSASFESKT